MSDNQKRVALSIAPRDRDLYRRFQEWCYHNGTTNSKEFSKLMSQTVKEAEQLPDFLK